MGFEVALLDIDGTLLDSTYHHTIAWARAFSGVGHPVPVWKLHRHIGMGGDRLIPAVSSEEIAERFGDELTERHTKAYDELIGETGLLPGARELLDGLRAAGLEVVLASSSQPKHAKHALELLDADDRTDAWTTSEDASESKPDPELLETALDRVSGSRALMIGDATWDVEAASQANIPTIGLLSGGFGEDELRTAGAVVVYRDPADLLASLDEALSRAGG
ncbi:haloacid dehalogenase superfamily, subfamily IA, variant 3 with third motif having DD or ED/haloacid dehalogenase superfamily, subfamily IA, variant 1 with third motif having Dx(3-4)D or Dx(3-4)E [Nocardioides terrae]|uniref:Haloacid dehalogenase superfamily, subfamily IA, variant 3 with third motif having DD or ED/haloacid dehalogenase superfamily, subfamily IA, variant 1 with third motif having Dx(3-4)D or Dx(3-4)E n=1 Tax=Nocardioides terrae TaxID=574651 RepID=A0A1I1IBB1_9ACTN|nr:HAD family hydrolase [Nocardioides terrae]SFC33454.1 haloacid dehalogenase superfamily, subfamily IA, variant 3 with third motif having DD or ED/haloacid dehalogenase superfamily, subfamily IA, variant 1 with third motif having Dx(3-4)D or Dx(3-4)E [Nocardioides terrae]